MGLRHSEARWRQWGVCASVGTRDLSGPWVPSGGLAGNPKGAGEAGGAAFPGY